MRPRLLNVGCQSISCDLFSSVHNGVHQRRCISQWRNYIFLLLCSSFSYLVPLSNVIHGRQNIQGRANVQMKEICILKSSVFTLNSPKQFFSTQRLQQRGNAYTNFVLDLSTAIPFYQTFAFKYTSNRVLVAKRHLRKIFFLNS